MFTRITFNRLLLESETRYSFIILEPMSFVSAISMLRVFGHKHTWIMHHCLLPVIFLAVSRPDKKISVRIFMKRKHTFEQRLSDCKQPTSLAGKYVVLMALQSIKRISKLSRTRRVKIFFHSFM